MKVGVPGTHLPCHLSLPLKTCFTLPPYHLGDLTTDCFSLQHPPISVCKVLRKGSPLLVTGFSCGWAGKESACNAGDLSSISGLGRSPGEGKGSPLQYSGLENSLGCKESDTTEGLSLSLVGYRSGHILLLSQLLWPGGGLIDQQPLWNKRESGKQWFPKGRASLLLNQRVLSIHDGCTAMSLCS